MSFRFCAHRAVYDDDSETTRLFGVCRRLDVHVATDTWAADETDHGRGDGQVQVSPVGVHRERDASVPVVVFTVDNTGHDLEGRTRRFGCDQVAAVLAVLRHDFPDRRRRHGQDRFGGHSLHAVVRYVRTNGYCGAGIIFIRLVF